MLHDIGRFEQVRRYGTFADDKSINHGELGANILFRDGLIEEFVPELADLKGMDIWNTLDNAIRYHSVYRVPEELNERDRMFTDLLRDADKIDILRVNYEVGVEKIYNVTAEEARSCTVTDEVMEAFKQAVLRKYKKTPVDHVVGHISLVFELVFSISLELALSQGYLNRLLDYPTDNETTRQQFARIREIMEEYIRERMA